MWVGLEKNRAPLDCAAGDDTMVVIPIMMVPGGAWLW